MKIKVYTLHSFTKTVNGGNPAGVVLDADGLEEKAMLRIAAEVGFSETAFCSKIGKGKL
jgi:PhzF family phenazine biosynthesis protein